ncbi:MAG: PfkB family carbohydrate kinase [Pseudomonadota bacterium]
MQMILVGGENLIDFIQEPPDGGHPAYRSVPGGAPFNVAKAIARQGQRVGYLTPFSTDPLGQQLAADLEAEAGMTALHPVSDCPTSLAVVSLNQGQAQYQFYRERTAERDVTIASLRAAAPADARAFFVGSLALTDGEDAEAWAQLFVALHDGGIFTSIDPNIRAAFIHDRPAYESRLERLLAATDLLKLSDEDIAWLAPGEDPRDAARQFAARTQAGLTVLTLGSDGAFGISGAGEIAVPVHPVPNLKDTVGAGDTFMGTLVTQAVESGRMTAGALRAMEATEVRKMLERAARAAALNCGRVGCDPPTRAELDAQTG